MQWLNFGNFSADIGVLLDPLSLMMLVVIGVVASMVVLYSVGYMRTERGLGRYFAFLGLFVFSMLGLVVATNIFQMYVFWELVGVSSYLLIGFYYTKPAAVAASKKAFIVTRFADLFFLIGILFLSFSCGTFDFSALNFNDAELVRESMSSGSATWAMALIFVGAAGKSAMFPLHIWLPDAMEGPTPVSALIHAATMVVAGIYLLARMFPVFEFAAPDVLTVVMYVGAFTALFAALIATQQSDIKRVLAFSTISQIAYMMTALGCGNVDAGLFHLFTHAFFKALLFLGAGAVIHAVHSNEMAKMGALRKYMPVTNISFLIACLAISGVPPFSGFFSKDAILSAAWEHDKLIFFTLLFVSVLTAFYMFRLYFRVFCGEDKEYEKRPKEASWTMCVPLVILAVLTCGAGFVHSHFEWGVAITGVGAAAVGIFFAWRGEFFWRAARERFYVDNVWRFFAHKIIFNYVSRPVAWFDRRVVDGFFDLLGTGTLRTAEAIKTAESGRVQSYAVVFVAAVLIITLLTLVL